MKHTITDFDPLAPPFLEGRRIELALRGGSHLYGVASAQSDIDMRYVFMPTRREILLGRNDFGLDSNPDNLKMASGNLDGSGYAFARFVKLLGRLEMGAVELLFASGSSEHVQVVSALMAEVHANRDALLAGSASAAIGHARQIAGHLLPADDIYLATYAAAHALVCRARDAGAARLCDAPDSVNALAQMDSVRIMTDETSGPREYNELSEAEKTTGRIAGGTVFLEVVSRRFPLASPISQVIASLEKPLRREMSRRAKSAPEAVSYKDAYHAVRLLSQAVELFERRRLTFPRPEAPLLRKVREGRKSLDEIRDRLDALFERVSRLQCDAPFPEFPDEDVQERIVMEAHARMVAGGS